LIGHAVILKRLVVETAVRFTNQRAFLILDEFMFALLLIVLKRRIRIINILY
jgi:hypothetical protein